MDGLVGRSATVTVKVTDGKPEVVKGSFRLLPETHRCWCKCICHDNAWGDYDLHEGLPLLGRLICARTTTASGRCNKCRNECNHCTRETK